MNEKNLASIASRKGYGIASSFHKRGNPDTASQVGAWADGTQDRGTREVLDVESDSGIKSLLAGRVQIKCPQKVTVRLKFYRTRLADYSRAISEKALLDGIVWAGLLRDDSEDEIWIEDEGQEKVATKEEERTVITLEYPDVDYDRPWEPRTQHKQLGFKHS
jgi:hypothetical protein